jgi:anthranilate phosphoribosyltransferase
MQILEGKGTSVQNAVVSANAGLAIHCARPENSVTECIAFARESLISGRALRAFQKLLAA